MIRVSVLYPNAPGNTFNNEYYFGTHMPMVAGLLRPGMKAIGAEQGTTGLPGSPAPFFAIAYMDFESMEAFDEAFTPHAAQIMGDIPVYFNAEPVIQISEIKYGQ